MTIGTTPKSLPEINRRFGAGTYLSDRLRNQTGAYGGFARPRSVVLTRATMTRRERIEHMARRQDVSAAELKEQMFAQLDLSEETEFGGSLVLAAPASTHRIQRWINWREFGETALGTIIDARTLEDLTVLASPDVHQMPGDTAFEADLPASADHIQYL